LYALAEMKMLPCSLKNYIEGRETCIFIRENCLCAKSVPQKIAKTEKTYYGDKRLFSFAFNPITQNREYLPMPPLVGKILYERRNKTRNMHICLKNRSFSKKMPQEIG